MPAVVGMVALLAVRRFGYLLEDLAMEIMCWLELKIYLFSGSEVLPLFIR